MAEQAGSPVEVLTGHAPGGLRFAATALPHGERPGNIRAERNGAVLETRPQPMGRPRPQR
jgi:hypothetical protein